MDTPSKPALTEVTNEGGTAQRSSRPSLKRQISGFFHLNSSTPTFSSMSADRREKERDKERKDEREAERVQDKTDKATKKADESSVDRTSSKKRKHDDDESTERSHKKHRSESKSELRVDAKADPNPKDKDDSLASPPTSPGRNLKKSSSNEILNGVMGAVHAATHALQRRASQLKIRRIGESADTDSVSSPSKRGLTLGMKSSASFPPPMSAFDEEDETPRAGDDWPWVSLDSAPILPMSSNGSIPSEEGMDIEVNLFAKEEGSVWSASTRAEAVKSLSSQASQRHSKQWLSWYRTHLAPSSEGRSVWLASTSRRSGSGSGSYLLVISQKEIIIQNNGSDNNITKNENTNNTMVEVHALLCSAVTLQRAELRMAPTPELKRADIVAMSALRVFACTAKELLRVRPEIETQVLAQVDQLVQLEASAQLKVGVLLTQPNQSDENAILHNQGGSDAYKRFLNLMADEVTLKGWAKFNGGLDVARDLTGKSSRYVAQGGSEIMFHVATMMPRDEDDEQALDVKRHIGNDVVALAYLDSDAKTFDPTWLHTHFTHVVCIIKSLGVNNSDINSEEQFAVQWAFKQPLTPCFASSVVPASKLRDFLFNHLTWSEHFAYSAPVFSQKFERTRSAVLQLVRTWQEEGSVTK